jgi:hypothetical protein
VMMQMGRNAGWCRASAMMMGSRASNSSGKPRMPTTSVGSRMHQSSSIIGFFAESIKINGSVDLKTPLSSL